MFRMQPLRLRLGWVGLLLALVTVGAIPAMAASPGDVVINEVAWMGTEASSSDEWIELYNPTDRAIDLTGWTLASDDGSPDETLNGSVPAQGFYLMERTDDDTVADIAADRIYTGNLSNSGESLTLTDADNNVISTANAGGGDWPAGDSDTYATMERIDPLEDDRDDNWATHDGSKRNGHDADGDAILGTPNAVNAVTPTNAAPSCSDVALTVEENHSASVDPDCSDPDNDGLSYAIVDGPEHGSADVDNGKLRYAPDADYVGSDTFTYRADDGQATSSAATVNVEVTAAATEGDGDPNDDGAIDAIDARVCLQIAKGMGSFGDAQRTACDVDGDGAVDRDDAERIAERAIGLIDDVNARGWWLAIGLLALGLPAAWRHRSASARSAMLSALLVGLAGLLTACPSLIPALPQDAVGIQATVSSKAIRVEVQNMPNDGVAALGIAADGLAFNAEALRIQDVEPADGWTVLARDIDNGSGDVRLVAVQTNSGTTDGRILTLPLQQRAGFSRGAADVEWNSTQLTLGDAANTEIDDFQTGTQP